MKTAAILFIFLTSCATLDRHYNPETEVKKIETKEFDQIIEKF